MSDETREEEETGAWRGTSRFVDLINFRHFQSFFSDKQTTHRVVQKLKLPRFEDTHTLALSDFRLRHPVISDVGVNASRAFIAVIYELSVSREWRAWF